MSSNETEIVTLSFSPVQLGALALLMILAFAGPIAMPFNLSAIAAEYNTSNTIAGLVAAAELLSISISSLLMTKYTSRVNVRLGLTVSLGAVAIANLATVFLASSPETLAPCRVIAGLAAGTAVAQVMFVAGRSNNPNATFGVINGSVGLMGMGLSIGLPIALGAFGLIGAYSIYLVCAAVALVLIGLLPRIPKIAPQAESADAAPRATPVPMIGWIALAGPLVAGFIGQGLSTVGRVGAILGVLAVAAYFLSSVEVPVAFYIAGPIFAALPLAIMPIILSALTILDPSARLVGAHPGFLTFAGAFAPFVGGWLSDLGGYSFTGVFAIGCILVGGGLMLGAARLADRMRANALSTASAPSPAQ